MYRSSKQGHCRCGVRVACATLLVIAAFGSKAAAEEGDGQQGVRSLTQQLRALSPAVQRDEAKRIATRSFLSTEELARRYRPFGPPQLHNFLVNTGVRKRGLCHHWARDLGQRLAATRPRSLVLRWGIARAGTLREHNAVVVTARGQRFEEGIVLDAWRHSGRLYFGPVAGDKYPWQEDRRESFEQPGRD